MVPMTGFKWLLCPLLLIVLFGTEAKANTFTAASCNQTDVQSAINLASNGDTVNIPNGTCSWTGSINLTKQITLQGVSTTCYTVGACGLVIQDNNTNTCNGSPCPDNAVLLIVNQGASFHTVIANMSFQPGASLPANNAGAYILVRGNGGLVPLLHDVYTNENNFQLEQAIQWMVTGGVIWHLFVDSTNNTNGACGGPILGSDSGSLLIKGNKNWDDASTMGTLDDGTNNTYIEDSTFQFVGQSPDMDDNARVVLRHVTFTNISGMLTHGPTSTFGARHVEIYDNTFNYTNTNKDAQRWVWGRAGTFVITGNTVAANSGGCHGTRDSWTFIVESATRGTGHGCCTSLQCFHQPGTGSDGTSGHTSMSPSQTPNDTFQQSDPIYIWGNSGAGASKLGMNDADMSCNTGNTTATFFHANQQYFLDNGAKPGWTRFTYPHPLRGTSSVGTPAPPTNLSAVVQ
jgi:hypothetical protein